MNIFILIAILFAQAVPVDINQKEFYPKSVKEAPDKDQVDVSLKKEQLVSKANPDCAQVTAIDGNQVSVTCGTDSKQIKNPDAADPNSSDFAKQQYLKLKDKTKKQ